MWPGVFVSGGSSPPSVVSHVDDEGHDLGDGFEFDLPYPIGIAYYGGRVYMHVGDQFFRIASYKTDGTDFLHEDEETRFRLGSTQVELRAYPSGLGTVGLGQLSKVATLDLSRNVADHPWYPMAFHGNGVNDPDYQVTGNAFETCSLSGEGIVIGEPDPACGRFGYADTGDGTHPGFNYAIDTAPGLGGLYVADRGSNRVTHINTLAGPGATIDMEFGIGPGAAAGQLDAPRSIVVQRKTEFVYVSEEGNRRISVFDAGGHYLASFGYGVRDGADAMQVCGVEIGQCRAGVAYESDPRSYFTRLDIGPEGELLAYMPKVGQIQVFSVPQDKSGGGGSGGSAPGGGPGGVAGSRAGTAHIVQRVRLGARPLRVRKGRKTRLTATVNRGSHCAGRRVLFQVKDHRSWDNLGRPVRPNKKRCKASKRVKVRAKSVFRAVLIDAKNHATLARSPKVTVKLR